ncbi:MAG: hypothetical protein SH868_13085 [Bythopirellula sp.]|nr:hypothetical protein [Bythopirellula sp.]
MNRLLSRSVCAATVLCGVATVAFSQNAPTRLNTAPTLAAAPASASNPATAAEREKIWNSPTMLRARAWVQEYCQRSAKITPAEEQAYMTELENLSPMQMKLWLLKFDHEEATIRQQQADFNRSRQAGLNQAASVDKATQQAYSNINRDENEAAATAEKSYNTQQAQAAQRGDEKQEELAADGTSEGGYFDPFGGYGYGPFVTGGGYGATHIHVHVHP